MSRVSVSDLAILGAKTRIKELEEQLSEAKAILTQLENKGRPRANRAQAKAGGKPKRRTRKVSPAAREAASQRMKAYWAARKQQQG